jgi:ABC-2 type transport system permease protein
VRGYLAIVQKELKSYFVSPLAYVVIFLFVLITGIFFYLYLSSFIRYAMQVALQAQYYRSMAPKLNINQMVIRYLFGNMSVFALFWLPLITMRSFAEEKKMGTIELLFTSPIKNSQTVLGKFTASLIIFVIMLALTFIYMIFLMVYGNPEIPPILTGYLGLFLIGTVYIAFGLFFSSITENQIIAAVATFGMILLFWVMGWIGNFVGPDTAEILRNLSIIEHFDDFAKGVIDTKHIVYYLSFAFFGVFLTYLSLESNRWRV